MSNPSPWFLAGVVIFFVVFLGALIFKLWKDLTKNNNDEGEYVPESIPDDGPDLSAALGFNNERKDQQEDIWKLWKDNGDIFTSPAYDTFVATTRKVTIGEFLEWYREKYKNHDFGILNPNSMIDGHYLFWKCQDPKLTILDYYTWWNQNVCHITHDEFRSRLSNSWTRSYFTNNKHLLSTVTVTEDLEFAAKTELSKIVHPAEYEFLKIMREILEVAEKEGVTPDRTGTGRVRVFGRTIRANLSDGSLPIPTTRKINPEHGAQELLWMIKGSTNLKDLADNTKAIWKGWAIEEKHIDAFIAKFYPDGDPKGLEHLKASMMKKYIGSIGPMYGHFWRNNPSTEETSFLPLDSLLMEDIPCDKREYLTRAFDEMLFINNNSPDQEKIEADKIDQLREEFVKTEYFNSNDQLGEVIRGIKRRPYSARHIISSWIPQYVPFESVLTPHENVLIGRGALTACHSVPIQFLVKKATDGGPDHLSLIMYQRSCDLAIGVCTNLNFYGIMLHMVAHCTHLRPAELIWHGGDVHLYQNHLETAIEQVSRVPLAPPKIRFNPESRDIFSMKREDFEIVDYVSHDRLKYDVSV